MLRIHDTMAARDVDFVPRVPGRASIYVCGPTVYDVPHVGHGRTALVFDIIRRYLEWSGYAVTYVSNVTNVEDKIIARAAAEGTSEHEVADRYEADVLGRSSTGSASGRPTTSRAPPSSSTEMVALIARARRRAATPT